MKKLLLLALSLIPLGALAQPVPATTPYTRAWLRSVNQSNSLYNLGIASTNQTTFTNVLNLTNTVNLTNSTTVTNIDGTTITTNAGGALTLKVGGTLPVMNAAALTNLAVGTMLDRLYRSNLWVVCEGDSMSAYWPASLYTNNFFTNRTIIVTNASVNGAGIGAMTNRYYQSVRQWITNAVNAGDQPVLLLWEGYNDLGVIIQDGVNYNWNLWWVPYSNYVAWAKADGAYVAVMTMPDVKPSALYEAGTIRDELRRALNERLRTTRGLWDCVIDVEASLNDARDPRYFQSDGIHPTMPGTGPVLAALVSDRLMAGTLNPNALPPASVAIQAHSNNVVATMPLYGPGDGLSNVPPSTATWTPKNFPGIKGWWSAESSAALSENALVTTVQDKSYHSGLLGTYSNQIAPIYTTAGTNGHGAWWLTNQLFTTGLSSPTNGPFTLMAMVYVTNANAATILAVGAGNTGVEWDVNNGVQRLIQQDTALVASGTTVITSNAWHQLMVTYDTNGVAQFYVDGAADARVTNSIIWGPGTFQIGTYGALPQTAGQLGWFRGKIAEVAIAYALPSTFDLYCWNQYAAGVQAVQLVGNLNSATNLPVAGIAATGIGATKYLKGDGTWDTPAGSGDAVLAANQTFSGTNTFLIGTKLGVPFSMIDTNVASLGTNTWTHDGVYDGWQFDGNIRMVDLSVTADAAITGTLTVGAIDDSARILNAVNGKGLQFEWNQANTRWDVKSNALHGTFTGNGGSLTNSTGFSFDTAAGVNTNNTFTGTNTFSGPVSFTASNYFAEVGVQQVTFALPLTNTLMLATPGGSGPTNIWFSPDGNQTNTGIIQATNFVGPGTGLTSLSTGPVTNALPAILTNNISGQAGTVATLTVGQVTNILGSAPILTNGISGRVISSETQVTPGVVDFAYRGNYTWFATNQAFTFSLPANLGTGPESLSVLVTNSTAAAVAATAPANVHPVGTWYVTNVTAFTWFHDITGWTNCVALPLW